MAEPGPMSGFKDILAEEMIPRQHMLDTVRDVYEGYGFTPLKTPALERLVTMEGKYGEEGDKLMYKFQDNGGRWVALRYDMTVPLARAVAQHGGRLPLPYKRYAVGEVWRGDRPQAGRYREFTQFDADTVGAKGGIPDAEIVAMMSDAMHALGADALIRVNNRRILDALVETAGISSEPAARKLIGAIDKVEKIGVDGVMQELAENFDTRTTGLVHSYLSLEGTPVERLHSAVSLLGSSDAAQEGAENLVEVFRNLQGSGYTEEQIVFDQSIARGLDYYTGIIYETSLKDLPSIGSVCSGGRYDNLIAALGGPDLPAVGTSIGVDRLYDGLQQLGKLHSAKTTTQVYVANFDASQAPEYMRIAKELRDAGIPAEVGYEASKVGKQLKMVDNLGIPCTILMGPQEASRGVAVIKDMETGEQTEVPVAELTNALQARVKK